MNWDKIQMKAAALKDCREATARAEAHARMKRAEQLAEDIMLQLGTLLEDALAAGCSAVVVRMGFPEHVEYEDLTALMFSNSPEGFRLKMSRTQWHIEVQMWALACPPANRLDYVEHDLRDNSYF